ncbi:hypothetical protein HK104_008309 [Borealophlyctis nickersoniae]|nr:hypothetical protein HK104_008309 [Borealophlyctis nickersoniae]
MDWTFRGVTLDTGKGKIVRATESEGVPPGRNFDLVGVSSHCQGDFLLVDISGPPTANQHTKHPQEDAIKLEEEAKKLLCGRLMNKFARYAGEMARHLEILSLQGIGQRLTLISWTLEKKKCIQARELFAIPVPFSRMQKKETKELFILGVVIKERFERLQANEQKVMSSPLGQEGETIRDWLPERV